MKNQLTTSFSKLKFTTLCTVLLGGFLIFSGISATSQSFYKKKSSRKKGSSKEAEWKKNVVWLEGLGSNQVVGVKYERIMHFGPFVSVRFDFGVTPFLVDEKYNFIVGRSITPLTGMGFYFNIPPSPISVGIGCTVLHDIFFDRIPETQPDSTGTNYPKNTYRARVMPYVVVEATFKKRWAIRLGYSPIIDPANDGQKNTFITHWATMGFGYKFGK